MASHQVLEVRRSHLVRALDITNGDRVVIDGEPTLIGSTHYSGDLNGRGVVTLCFAHGDVTVSSQQRMAVVR